MSRKLVAIGPDRVEWRDCGQAPLEASQVLVRCEYAAAKHGTERALIKRYGHGRGSWDSRMGLFTESEEKAGGAVNTGNMFVGPVEEVGAEVADLSPGERVCAYGPFAETHVLEAERCWKLPEEVPWQSAVCLDPADFALSAVRDGQVRIGDAAAVFGLGAIGLAAVRFALLSGADPVVGMDPAPNRREAAEELGATCTLDPTDCDAGLEIKKMTGGRGVDVAIEYSGAAAALQAALRAVAFGGNVVAGAFPPPYGEGLDFGAEAHFNRPNLIFSRACSDPNRDHPRWDNERIYAACRRIIEKGQLDGRHIVRPVVPVSELADRYLDTITDPEAGIKLGVEF